MTTIVPRESSSPHHTPRLCHSASYKGSQRKRFIQCGNMWYSQSSILKLSLAVPCRNRTSLHRIFQSHHFIRSAISQNFRQGWGSNTLRKCNNYYVILTLNGSSEILHFECSDTIEIHNRIMMVFYPGLPYDMVLTQISRAGW